MPTTRAPGSGQTATARSVRARQAVLVAAVVAAGFPVAAVGCSSTNSNEVNRPDASGIGGASGTAGTGSGGASVDSGVLEGGGAGGAMDDGGVGPDSGDAGTLPVDIVVALDGSDTPTCGAEASPCRTLKFAAETRAGPGQNIGIKPGTYDETGSIALPRTVSVTGMGGASEVILRPEFAMGSTQYLLNLVDDKLSQDGSQSLSNLTFEAHAASEVGWRAVHVQNRNNVRIHHCRFTNWDRSATNQESRAVQVDTTYAFPYPTSHWWSYIPQDPGAPGDYSTWTDWPKSPVENFEFDHNYVYRSGPNPVYTTANPTSPNTRPGEALWLINLKDSRIHHNEFDLRGVYADAIRGISAFWDHVDTYNNVFRSTNAYDEGWMGPNPSSRSNYVIETWMHLGCEFRDNITNDGFSIAYHKDGAIHHNILLRPTSHSIGIETGPLHDSQVHHNYILGGKGAGITVHTDKSRKFENAQIFENILIGIDNWGVALSMDSGYCDVAGAKDTRVYNNLVDSTLWGALLVRYKCPGANPLGGNVLVRNNIFMNARSGFRGVNFEMGPSTASLSSKVENNLFYGNAGGDGTRCKCIDDNNQTVACVNGCDGRGDDKTVSSDPKFEGPDVVIVNDSDSAGTSAKGSWVATSSSDLRRYADDARVNSGGAGDYFEFSAQNLPTSTATLVAMWWPRNFGENRASKVPVSIYDGSGTTPIATYVIDQKSWDSSGWYYLGMHVFASGTSRLRVESVPGAQVVADAVLWSKLGQGYKLASGSPAINAGSSAVTSVVKIDFFGNPVPNAGAPDIGIHER